MPSSLGGAAELRFHRRFFGPLTAGTKTTTIRWREDVTVGPVRLAFDDAPELPLLEATITGIARHRLDTLTPAQAHQPPDTDMVPFRAGMAEFYRDIPHDAEVDVVTLRLS